MLLSNKLSVMIAGLILLSVRLPAYEGYMTFFSAEQEDFRRLVIDGANGRRVQASLDTSGHVLITITGVSRKSYIGRMEYDKGFLVPARITVGFPTRNTMSIRVTGNRFADIVQYEIKGAGLHIIDLYTSPLPMESYFKEQTIDALWPSGRFEPDIHPTLSEEEAQAAPSLGLAATITREVEPYKSLIRRAAIWAGSVCGVFALVMLFGMFHNRRKRRRPAPQPVVKVEENGHKGKAAPLAPYAQAQELMAGKPEELSYEEATLLADLKQESLT